MSTVPPTLPEPSALIRRRAVSLHDVGVAAIFLAFAIGLHVYRAGEGKVCNLSSDAGNLASFAASLDHPQQFARDDLLDDSDNFRFYFSFHIPLVRLWASINHWQYGEAILGTYWLHVLLQFLGFYILGRVVLHNRLWAFALSVICGGYIVVGWAEAWGLFRDPLPRMSFSACLGFIWAAAIHWRGRPAAWLAVMAAMGAMMYVHPVSAPTIALALWIGFWLDRPEGMSRVRQGAWLVAAGTLMAFIATPFVWNYMTYHAHARSPNYAKIIEIMNYRMGRVWEGFGQELLKSLTNLLRSLVLPVGLAGAAAVALAGVERRVLRLIAVWIAAIATVALGVPAAEFAIARAISAVPPELDLVRGVRYVVPLLLLLGLWAAVELGRRWWRQRTDGRFAWASLATAGVLALSLTWVAKESWRTFARTMKEEKPGIEATLAALAEQTPPGSRILPVGLDPLAVRYCALRPVAFAYKDGGCFAYGNHDALLRWYDRSLEYDALVKRPPTAETAEAIVKWASRIGADFVVLSARETRKGMPQSGRVLWKCKQFVIVDLRSE